MASAGRPWLPPAGQQRSRDPRLRRGHVLGLGVERLCVRARRDQRLRSRSGAAQSRG